jgi:hypothetical protein
MTEKEIDKLFTYHTPTNESVGKLVDVREAARVFAKVIEQAVPDSADKTASFRKLRDCVMTCNAAIVLNQKQES